MSGIADDIRLARRLLAEARPYWSHLGAIWLLSLAAVPLALAAPLPVRIAIDSVLGDKPVPRALSAVLPGWAIATSQGRLWVVVMLLVAVAAAAGLHVLASWVVQASACERLTQRFRMRLFGHAQRLSLAYHDSRGSSDSVYRIQYDAISLQGVLVGAMTALFNPLMMVAAMVATTAVVDWQLAAVAVLVCPALYAIAGAFRARVGTRWDQVKQLESAAMGVVQEMLGAVRVVKAFRLEEQEQSRFLRISDDRIREYLSVATMRGRIDLLVGVTMAVGTALVLLIGVRHVNEGRLTLGALLMVMAYLSQIYEPLKTISASSADLQSALASARRAFGYLDELPEAIERPSARHLGRAEGRVTFRGVSFSYDKVRPVLRDVSFDVPAGARVGIQGHTGAGKSTLASLLMRFYDPDSGQILLDGIDARDLRLADLRDQFAIVLQEPVLFSTTIFSNIACGRPGASRDDVIRAARMANALDFIEALPLGFETPVGERGMALSGGERQRISLARAFAKDAPILVLDEPTSSVDVATESLIVEAIERLMNGRTTFVIAHRLSTLERSDVRLLVDGGHVEVLRAAV